MGSRELDSSPFMDTYYKKFFGSLQLPFPQEVLCVLCGVRRNVTSYRMSPMACNNGIDNEELIEYTLGLFIKRV